jgi:hypothetical protein
MPRPEPWPADAGYVLTQLALWHTITEIGVLLGRTKTAVRKKVWKLGIRIRHWENGARSWDRSERQLLWLAAGEESQEQFGARIGRSRSSIEWVTRKAGIRWTAGRISLSAVARLTGCSTQYASQKAKGLWPRRKPARGSGIGRRYNFSYEQAEALVRCIRPGRVSWVRDRL